MSKARSPRDVCSTTMGISGLTPAPRGVQGVDRSCPSCRLLARRGPQFRLGLVGFLVGRPDRLTGARDLDRNRLDLGGHAVECGAQPQIVSQLLGGRRAGYALEDLLGVV